MLVKHGASESSAAALSATTDEDAKCSSSTLPKLRDSFSQFVNVKREGKNYTKHSMHFQVSGVAIPFPIYST